MHPDLVIFLGISVIPVVILLRYRRLASMDKGVLFILVGTGILSIACLIDYLKETLLASYMLSVASKNSWNMLITVFGHIPGIFITGIGLSRWFQVVMKLEREVKRRERAEEDLRDRSEQLRQALAAAEEANRAKTEFLAKMSHELRTPLNAIIGFSEVMTLQLYGKLGDKQYEEYTELIHSSGKLLLDIINDILDLSKVEAGRVELEEEAFFLRSLVSECLPIVQTQVEENNVSIMTELQDDLVLWADRRIVKQMLLNLLSNALKFTPTGGTVRVISCAGRDGSHILEVQDSGVGMTSTELRVAMEPFGQVQSVMVNNHSGTGLGLALVNTFMGLHDGKFEVLSEKGQGTRARLVFPSARAVSPAAAE